MESTNNNLHHLQDTLQLQSSSSSSYGVLAAISTTNSWTPIISLNAAGNLNQNLQEANHRSRSLTDKKDCMIQDLGYHQHQHEQQWMNDAGESCLNSINHHHHHHHHIQLDSTSSSHDQFSVGFPKFSEMLNSNTALPSTFITGNLYSTNNDQNYPNFGATSISSQIYPTINISNLNQNQNQNHPSLNLDLLSHHSQHQHLSHNNLSFSLHHMQQQNPTDTSSCNSSSTNTSLFSNGSSIAETKRPCTLMESKRPCTLKKSRSSSESRPSCPPFKVRKEKLGDRIAALQQLVAPFGKTDTASVLMEAIGYIKFLQGQVETLSVPYMKSSQKHTNKSIQRGLVDGEAKQDLRSRGLCLVPLSCMSYIAGDGGTEVWQQQPNFGGGPT